MRIYYLFCLAIWIMFSGAISLPLYASDGYDAYYKNTDFSRRFLQKWGKHPIKVRQKILNNRISGSLANRKSTEKAAERFFAALGYLPPELIKKSGLKYVTFVWKLKLNNQSAGGIAVSGNTIFLPVRFSERRCSQYRLIKINQY